MASSRLRKLLKPILAFAEKNGPFRIRSAVEQTRFVLGKPSTKGKKPAAARKQKKWDIHKAETGALRAAVFQRAGGLCEVVEPEGGRCGNKPRHMDHWLGGTGRRRQVQALENCWAICFLHHDRRTINWPSVAAWNARFRLHCDTYGYPFTPHIEHQPIPARGQAASATPLSADSAAPQPGKEE